MARTVFSLLSPCSAFYFIMRTVCFMGLCREEVGNMKEDALRRLGVDQIWTMNNYYLRSLIDTPDRVFQCHPAQIDSDMIEAYNRSGAEIITPMPVAGLERNRVFDPNRIVPAGARGFLSSSFASMWLLAWAERWERICLLGCPLRVEVEYISQVPSMLAGIKRSRELGVSVFAPHEKSWLGYHGAHPDWDDMPTSDRNYFELCEDAANGTEG